MADAVRKLPGLFFSDQQAAKPAAVATEMPTTAPAAPPQRVNLNVPFAHKDLAKTHGARWDALQKVWYAPSQDVANKINAAIGPLVVQPYISDTRRAAIHQAVKQLHADNPDMAGEKNNIGYNGFDSQMGASLAMAPKLSDKQAHAAAKMLHKYKRQLGDALHKIVTTDEPRPTGI
jgi:hypothetical protein